MTIRIMSIFVAVVALGGQMAALGEEKAPVTSGAQSAESAGRPHVDVGQVRDSGPNAAGNPKATDDTRDGARNGNVVRQDIGQVHIPVQDNTAPKEASVARAEQAVDVASRLAEIDAAVTKLANKSSQTVYITAAVGVFGVLFGAGITLLTQGRLFAHQRRLEIRKFFVQWQFDQLSNLYGPLHALFHQSNALYRHMNTVLVGADPQRFRLRPDPKSNDYDKKIFEIRFDDGWARFRTVMNLDEVYGRGYGIEDYFDEIVSIGERIVKVIEDKAGYARSDQQDLAEVFGKYLAHYSVLRRLHSQLKLKHNPSPSDPSAKAPEDAGVANNMKVDMSAAFPSEIQTLVDQGYFAITKELNAWRNTCIS